MGKLRCQLRWGEEARRSLLPPSSLLPPPPSPTSPGRRPFSQITRLFPPPSLLLPLLLPYGRGEYTAGLGHAGGASGNRRAKKNFILCSYFVGAVRKAVGRIPPGLGGGVYFQHGDGGGRETGEEKSRKLWSSSIASPLPERHPYKLAQPLLSQARYLEASSKARERYGMIHFNIGQKYLNFAFETHEAPSRNRSSCKLESQHSSLVLAAQFRFQGQHVS